MVVAFTTLLSMHILSGTFAILAGVVAMATRKGGGALHARAGRWFTTSMLGMAGTAAILTAWDPDRLSLVTAIWTGYLVITSWATVRSGSTWSSKLMLGAIPVGLACSVLHLANGFEAMKSESGTLDGFGAEPYFVFGAIAGLAFVLDLNTLARKTTTARQRIARHLWRMCVAYLLAVSSLFLGQQDDVFWFMSGSPVLFLPTFATLIFMLFWIVRVRLAKRWLRPGPSRNTPRKEAPC